MCAILFVVCTDSQICLEMLRDDKLKFFPAKLVDFFNQTGACDEVCGPYAAFGETCSPFDWQNGVCDEFCNVQECNFDGGDCNQLCLITNQDCDIYSMLANDECNVECNNTYCSWDFGDCSNTFNLSDINGTYCNIDAYEMSITSDSYSSGYGSNYNTSNGSNTSISTSQNDISEEIKSQLCETSWINDGWCDENCRHSDSCFNDGNDCECQSTSDSYCLLLYAIYSELADYNDESNEYILGYESFCAYWDLIKLYENWRDLNIENGSCSYGFEYFDRDLDDDVDMHEIIYGLRSIPPYNATALKASQINCTVCAGTT